MALIYVWLLAEVMIARGGANQIAFILFAQLVLVTLFMPISVYGAISGERERTTWEALVLTRLTHGQIVVGKIIWRVAGLLILMALFLLPLVLSVIYSEATAPGYPQPLYISRAGYVPIDAWRTLIEAEMMTFTWGFALCAYGLWVSANTRKSVTSAALIFISLLTVLVLLPVLFSMIGGPISAADYSGNYGAWILMHINSFYAMGQLCTPLSDYNYGNNDAPDPLFGTEWGILQTGVYLAGAAIFIYATYRTLKLWEEHKNRIG